MGLKSSGGTPIRTQLRLSYPSTNDGRPPFARLEVIDEASSLVFLEVELDADSFMRLMSNSTAYADAGLCKHLGRIGKVMQHGSENWGRVHYDAESLPLRVEEWRRLGGWDTAESHRNNAGHTIVLGRRWVEVFPDAEFGSSA